MESVRLWGWDRGWWESVGDTLDIRCVSENGRACLGDFGRVVEGLMKEDSFIFLIG